MLSMCQDTVGRERYYSINTFYCILVFDLTNANSFKTVDTWKQICDNSNNTVGGTRPNIS